MDNLKVIIVIIAYYDQILITLNVNTDFKYNVLVGQLLNFNIKTINTTFETGAERKYPCFNNSVEMFDNTNT